MERRDFLRTSAAALCAALEVFELEEPVALPVPVRGTVSPPEFEVHSFTAPAVTVVSEGCENLLAQAMLLNVYTGKPGESQPGPDMFDFAFNRLIGPKASMQRFLDATTLPTVMLRFRTPDGQRDMWVKLESPRVTFVGMTVETHFFVIAEGLKGIATAFPQWRTEEAGHDNA